MRKINLIICLVAIMATASYSQYVKMGVSSVKAENAEQQQQMEGTMKTMKMETFANDDKIRTDVNMMGGMVVMSTFTNQNSDQFTIYMDMMGNKMKVVPTASELTSLKSENDKKSSDFKIVEVPGDTKTILGFNCKRYNITSSEGMNLTMYATKDIKIKPANIQGMEGLVIDGYPLEYTMEAMGAKMTFTAEKFEKSFDVTKMNPPTGNYKELNLTDFKKQMPGM